MSRVKFPDMPSWSVEERDDFVLVRRSRWSRSESFCRRKTATGHEAEEARELVRSANAAPLLSARLKRVRMELARQKAIVAVLERSLDKQDVCSGGARDYEWAASIVKAVMQKVGARTLSVSLDEVRRAAEVDLQVESDVSGLRLSVRTEAP